MGNPAGFVEVIPRRLGEAGAARHDRSTHMHSPFVAIAVAEFSHSARSSSAVRVSNQAAAEAADGKEGLGAHIRDGSP
jgi:hypothetical protein